MLLFITIEINTALCFLIIGKRKKGHDYGKSIRVSKHNRKGNRS